MLADADASFRQQTLLLYAVPAMVNRMNKLKTIFHPYLIQAIRTRMKFTLSVPKLLKLTMIHVRI